jgi:uncharacterized membrane protein (UPF0127 family)
LLGGGVAVVVIAIGVAVYLLANRDDSRSKQSLADFGTTHVTVTSPEGSLEWCMLLAATEQERNRGLMGVTDPTLNGHDGMLFRFDADTNDRFYMRDTPMPLSIAFVGSDGHIVSTADMAPCADMPGCPLYPAAGPYRNAIEVPEGGLQRLGIVPGATLVDDHRSC